MKPRPRSWEGKDPTAALIEWCFVKYQKKDAVRFVFKPGSLTFLLLFSSPIFPLPLLLSLLFLLPSYSFTELISFYLLPLPPLVSFLLSSCCLWFPSISALLLAIPQLLLCFSSFLFRLPSSSCFCLQTGSNAARPYLTEVHVNGKLISSEDSKIKVESKRLASIAALIALDPNTFCEAMWEKKDKPEESLNVSVDPCNY